MKSALLFCVLLVVSTTYGFGIRGPKQAVGDPMLDFIEGFLEGLNEKGDVNKLLECLKNIEPITLDIMEALELIMKLNYKDIIEGVGLLMKAIKELMDAMKPCSEGFEQLKKFMEAIKNFDIRKIAAKILQNIAAFMKDIAEIIEDFKEGDWYGFGKGLGDIMFRLFLQEASVEFDFDEFIKLVEGLLDGMGHGQKFIDVEKCLEHFPEIYKEVLDAIKLIKELNIHDIAKLVEAIMKLVEAVRKVLDSIKPCSTAPHELEEMIKKLLHIDFAKLLQKIISNTGSLMGDVMGAIQNLKDKKYYDAGKDLGDVLYLLVFKD